ncbi:MAG: alcohol dehydrogenase [Pelagibacteraceae bacterium BACL5 MAG-120705-bin12]|jgi:alcohol dehydrogenase class IV|uniref:iron-containing alcohol dehydrogenase n=1 Tax=Candidatus Pelagibacter sp. TaxID=2024849 RepID=UPI000715B11D|nr:MAG: alcohol dehydrogenase [Pelagibacteraceae bacterium BACL5 MAG-121015-bin10]KRO60335.1 MAG: alcohol dehydrogenase [Pelagibacteraceae bacterium BACL5 MAG-120705-bin12]KRO60864.1 MAG: alcohol dehydrogenase [Pelagibacteraceae bacterium BACL5 MAG-121128-bin54]KRO64572.1 MAG: alcohol dehydrogenase [Pelagibacteraceae bacterium BACL5 MAG-120820-bin39]KRO75051.1 MAG: alcohol dehydrogenase [Pelagibacteraceae bacterium BACL5 MAG-120813-bin20]
MQKYNWNYPTTVWVGEDRIKDLGNACTKLNIKKPLLVTDSGLAQSEIVKNTLANLKENNIPVELYSNVVGNPTGTNVNEGVAFYKQNNCDGVIAFGGGSGLDVGKAIAFMSGQILPIWDFEDVGDNWTRANSETIAPIIAVPTTAGTGSETGRASVILNEDTGVKNIIFHPKFLPSIVILDPLLTLGLPAKITAATGMDALAHNLEAYCAPGFHPMADGIALEGMRLINKWLLEAVNNGSNVEARMNMLTAASMGSTAFQKGLGAIHSLSHPVNALNNVHHGLSNAIFMPYVLTFNKDVIEEKIIKICNYLELQDRTFNGFINWVLDLRKKLNMPHKLSEVIKEEDFDLARLSKMALADPSTGGNPKPLTENDMKVMYQHSMSGTLFE